jgi:hypothetical protein
MPRQRLRDWPLRVYVYGARLFDRSTPPTWPAPLRQVVGAQHDLWNACHAAWGRNRAQYEALMQQNTALEPLYAARDTARAAVQACRQTGATQRQHARQRHYPGWQTDQAALAEATATLTTATQTLRTAEAAYRTAIKPQLTALLDALAQEVHALGQAAPLAWYNERQVTEAFLRAVQGFLARRGGPPQPRRALTQAHVTYHFTNGGLPWDGLFTGATGMVQIDPLRPDDRRGWSPVYLRISDTATLTFTATQLTRQPPAGAIIKGVELVGREVLRPFAGRPGRWNWSFHVVCEIPPAALTPVARPGRGTAALDLGWRVREDGVRLGMLYDGTTYTELVYPAALLAHWRHAHALQEALSKGHEACKAALTALWETTPLPPDVDPRGAGWAQVGQSGLLRLAQAVTALPAALPSRTATLAVLTPWQRRTAARWREWRGLVGRLERARDHLYATLSAQLCREYAHLTLEALDVRALAATPTPDTRPPRLQASQQYRQLLAPGRFRQRLRLTAEREGTVLVEVSPALSTRTCPVCAAVLTADQLAAQGGELHLVCPHGHAYEQDRAAALWLWRRATAGAAPDGTP